MSIRVPFFTMSLAAAISFSGCIPKKAQVQDPTEVGRYAAEAKMAAPAKPGADGSLWIPDERRSDLFSDFKARNVNDVVTIRVDESTQALSSAEAKNSKGTDLTAGFDALFGAEKRINELPNLVAGKASSSFEGKGSTSRATTLQTTLTARVIDVLPNGYLVVEGMRAIRVNNENQNVYLTGVVRPVDISRNNIVLSSRVAQMEVRVQGRGIVSQPLRPGWLYRILNGVLPF